MDIFFAFHFVQKMKKKSRYITFCYSKNIANFEVFCEVIIWSDIILFNLLFLEIVFRDQEILLFFQNGHAIFHMNFKYCGYGLVETAFRMLSMAIWLPKGNFNSHWKMGFFTISFLIIWLQILLQLITGTKGL